MELEEASASKKAMDTQALADDAQRYVRDGQYVQYMLQFLLFLTYFMMLSTITLVYFSFFLFIFALHLSY